MALKFGATNLKFIDWRHTLGDNFSCKNVKFTAEILPTIRFFSLRFFHTLCDVDNGLEEVGVSRNASQSTTYLSSSAARAVDGSYLTGSCTKSTSYNQWLAIDINHPSVVKAVNVTNDGNNYFCEFLFLFAFEL